MQEQGINLFWFRRDLRLQDNTALYHALKDGPTLPLFIFDENILSKLPKNDRRVNFIYDALQNLNKKLAESGKAIVTRKGAPIDIIPEICKEYPIKKVFFNDDFEPYGISRDAEIKKFLDEQNVEIQAYTDHVIFHPNAILKSDNTPYTVYTPYAKKWKEALSNAELISFPSENLLSQLIENKTAIPSLKELGFEEELYNASFSLSPEFLKNYEFTRNFPIEITSKMGPHLRFGTFLSIRQVAKESRPYSSFLNELIWREFFVQILYHFPEVVHQSFKQIYDKIQWRNDEAEFEKWKNGDTGYPIVDAGMRELNDSGFMHNRARMICASFLSKHLLIDWCWGEAYFAEKLLDFELASNNGNWQWAAGSGCDAAPYFRVFNPYIQTKKFDPEYRYIKKWVPEFDTEDYPEPMVDHQFARNRALETYKKALSADKL